MGDIKFKIAAKTDTGLVRTNNEDNFQAASDLGIAPMKWINDAECILGSKGALLVVADGMGGMNAGEVASEIAIETIKEHFSPNNITEQIISSDSTINFFLKKAIIEADRKIKKEAKETKDCKGMGTTIVIAWLLKDKLYVAWCGDSRAYIYNKVNGLRQITKDHSYVQSLIDKKKIEPEDAFDFPDSNIITRSLSDSSQKARPDVLASPITVCNGDIILLCTDGLSGMIRDHEIEQVLMENEDNTSDCADSLIKSACNAAGEDNITVALCKIVSGCSEPTQEQGKNSVEFHEKDNNVIWAKRVAIPLLLGLILGFPLGYKVGLSRGVQANQSRDTATVAKPDTTLSVKKDGTDTLSNITEVPSSSERTVDTQTASANVEQTMAGKINTNSKTDTLYVVKQNDILSTIEKTINRRREAYDVMRGDSFIIRNGKVVSEQIHEHDTLLFKKRVIK